MQVAILAPGAVPFTIGGAERLCWGLQNWLNEHTRHQVELIRLPSPEGDFWSLLDSYRAFSRLDVRHFDCVVSTKYPSWMVQHPRHVCYMLHRLRGLYDAYHLFKLPERVDHAEPRLRELQAFMRAHQGDRGGLEHAFGLLDALRGADGLPDGAFAFPGPLIREIVHYLDGIGLSTTSVTRFAAISQTVAKRPNYFPAGAKVAVAYPPPQGTGFHCGGGEYLFTLSRLDGPKRLDVLIEAMRRVRAPVELRIAGTGPEAQHLRELAAGDRRIRFLGYINDAEAVDQYAGALAVPFVPYDEDFGLVTLEAMLSSKPVITLKDAGGPREFVEHGVTGLVADANPRALAAAIEEICADREAAARMGRAGFERAQAVGWAEVARTLLDDERSSAGPREARKSLVVALSYPVFPPRGGGQTRVFHLYRHLARHFDVALVTLASHGSAAFDAEIAPGMREIRIPKSRAHEEHESALSAKVDWVPVTDAALPRLQSTTPEYARAIAGAARSARAIVASHPYAYPAIAAVGGAPLWYEAHNVEVALKRAMLPANAAGARLLQETREAEAACCARSELITTCTLEDGDALRAEFGTLGGRLVVVPNGVDLDSVPYVGPEERRRIKARLGLEGWPVALFLASWHGPNLDAMEFVLAAARVLENHLFLIVGSACQAIAARPLPSNVRLLGVVDDDAKSLLLGAADVALNPMLAGSGSNLKMLDYMAAGLPVISSPFGARGMLVDEELVMLAKPEELVAALERAAADPDAMLERARLARAHVERHFSWKVIAEAFLADLKSGRQAPAQAETAAASRSSDA